MRTSPQPLLAAIGDRTAQDHASQSQASRSRAMGRGLWTVALTCCILGALGGSARAQGFQSDILEGTLQALGLADAPPKPDIDYRERAPLVVPPNAGENLPPPVDRNAEANPNWPKDPDVERRRREAAAAGGPVVRDDPGRPLMPSELNKGRTKISSAYPSSQEPAATGSRRDELMPNQLNGGITNWFGALTGAKDKPLTFEGEPTRESLIQPPEGYQTPAPNAPYGVVEPKKNDQPFKVPNFFDMQK